MDKSALIGKVAQDGEDRLLLARILDQFSHMERRNIPAATGFLSPREQRLAAALLNAAGIRDCYVFDGGYGAAERKILIFLPDWAEEPPEEPLAFLRASFQGPDRLTHRDILGSLMGLGVTRERVGDILVAPWEENTPHSADIVASPSLREFFLREWSQAGRARLTVAEIHRAALRIPPAQVKVIRDTVSSLRLDAVVSSAFSMSRGRAAELIAAGRVSLDHVPCLKGDRPVAEGAVLTARGLGRARLTQAGGLTKKGRIGITIERYL